MIQRVRLWNAEVYPVPQWVDIAHVSDRGKDYCNDDDIYFYHEFDNVIEQWDYITLDEDFLVVEVEK